MSWWQRIWWPARIEHKINVLIGKVTQVAVDEQALLEALAAFRTDLDAGIQAIKDKIGSLPGIDLTEELDALDGIKTAFGTDILFSPRLARLQGALLSKLTRWYTPAQALIMATSTNAQLLALSGKRNPYPGKLGVVEQGALADLLLVDGNPLENINLIADPGKNFLIIMKDGIIYKNALAK